jgi:sec-independent protein translocase protein TatC
VTKADIIESESPEEIDGRMTVLEHLRELRTRLMQALGAVFLGFCLSWWQAEWVFNEILMQPLIMASPEMAQMHHKDLAEPFFVLLKTAIFCGIFLAMPFIFWQVWQFIAPGLYANEKRAAIPFVFLSSGFFVLGSGFCHSIVMPYGYLFLLNFSTGVSQPELMMNEYLALTTKLLLGFGIVFELPVFAMFLSMVGLITHRTLLKYWRHSTVIAFVVAAMLTPPDIVTQTMMAVPLIVLYFLSIGVAYFFTIRRERREAAQEN